MQVDLLTATKLSTEVHSIFLLMLLQLPAEIALEQLSQKFRQKCPVISKVLLCFGTNISVKILSIKSHFSAGKKFSRVRTQMHRALMTAKLFSARGEMQPRIKGDD